MSTPDDRVKAPDDAQGSDEHSVLLASPDTDAARALAETLRKARIGFVQAKTAAHALSCLADGEFAVVIAGDAHDSKQKGGLWERLNELSCDLPVLGLLEGEQRPDTSGLGTNAFDYIHRPFDEDATLDTVQRALQAARETQSRPPTVPLPALNEVLVRSPAMRATMSLVERVAPSDATVMIRGESGTGKEVVARRLHELSGRANGPLIKVHCAALPEQILESELFGYERGAFTGAHQRKPGRVELAEGGTLFLDEIGEISMSVQVKLLRLLQDRQYERLGGIRTLAANVRFVTATHRNLEQMVRTGGFREDLYYRLNVVRLDLPPLRERRADIEPLALHFCQRTNREVGRHVSLAPDALERIKRSDFRGNVRELQNFIERLVVLAESDIVSERDIQLEEERTLGLMAGSEPSAESSVVSLDAALRHAERHALEKALRKSAGNRALAARILGVSRRSLFYKLREHDIK
jgi:two-component system, NtrC family, response regulator AtoC